MTRSGALRRVLGWSMLGVAFVIVGLWGPEKGEAVGGWALLPPLVAILSAFLIGEVMVALLGSVWIGVWIGLGSDLFAFSRALPRVLDSYMVPVLTDASHLMVVLFSLFISGMVGILKASGSLATIADFFRHVARTRRRTMMGSYLLGVAVFFDDYANTLIVGNTMKDIFPRFRISRAKLAYIVDSTSAPVAAIALVTTWIGAQLGYIDEALSQMPDITTSSYAIFLQALPYAFYPLLTLWMVGLLIVMQRDYGPMYRYETAALNISPVTASEAADDGDKSAFSWFRLLVAVLPIVLLVGGTFGALWWTGRQGLEAVPESRWLYWLHVLGNGDPYRSLLWAAGSSVLLAVALSILYWKTSLHAALDGFFKGMATMLGAMSILVLAWMLGRVMDQLETAPYIVQLMPRDIGPGWLPPLFFFLAALTSFSTGSSWGTMAILYPLALPVVYAQGKALGLDIDVILPHFAHTSAVVLAGSVFGDHCSPISDTTILSAMASDCPLMEHVVTQLPYAVTVGLIALLIGHAGTALGLPLWLVWPVGLGAIWAIVRFYGKPLPVHPTVNPSRSE